MFKKVYFCLFVFVSGMAIEYSKMDQGISKGYLSDCPGSLKPAVIKPQSLKKLTISVLGAGNVLEAKWTKYNCYNIHKVAKNPEMNFSINTIMYIPGYFETDVVPLGRAMGTIYKELGYNVLILDYVHFTLNHYPIAARMVHPVGKHVGEMLANLTALGLDPKKLELVGFSLGSHVMGLAAKRYRKITGQNISSLTSLDPSGPCFRHLGPDQRLDPSDADFVLTVHTNIDGFGISTPLGHVSMFVNGGEYQAADIWSIPCLIVCSHTKAYALWLSALMNPGTFIALKCDSVQQARDGDCYERNPRVTNTMDLFVDKSRPGIYYIHTSNRYPYGLGDLGLERKNNLYPKYFNWINADDVLMM